MEALLDPAQDQVLQRTSPVPVPSAVTHAASPDDHSKVDLYRLHNCKVGGHKADVDLIALCWGCYNEARRIARVQRRPITKVLAEFVATGLMSPIRMSFLVKPV